MTLKHKHSILLQVPDFDDFTCNAPAPHPIGRLKLSREDYRQISRFSDFPEFPTTQKKKKKHALTSLTPLTMESLRGHILCQVFPTASLGIWRVLALR